MEHPLGNRASSAGPLPPFVRLRHLTGVAAVLCAVGAVHVPLLTSCSPKKPVSSGLAAAQSKRAQSELRGLEEEWELRSGSARAELRPALEDYVAQYQDDPSVARARLMLAQIALLERRLGSAEEILQPVLRGAPGRTRDEAEVIRAAIYNQRGDHDAALAQLAPLEGKLLTREARDQFARERTSAAIAARKWRLTIDAMIAWLVEAGTGSRQVQTWIKSAIVEVPTGALSRLLADWDKTRRDSASERAASDWLQRLVIEHLSAEALRSRDPHLARDLLERAPPWLRAGQQGDELAVLAALAQKEAQVVGRGVGIVLGGQSALERRRSVRVALGLIRGLNLGRAEGAPNGLQILAVEDRGSMRAALGTLTGLGASILIAGVEAEGATEALNFAESTEVPVVLMSVPHSPRKSSYAFTFGVGTEEQEAAARAGLPGSQQWSIVGDGGASCPTSGARPTTTTLPFAEWRETGTDAVLVLGDAACCLSVWNQVAGLAQRPRVVWGLEGAHTPLVQDQGPLVLTSADFPTPETAAAGDEITDAERELEAGGEAAAVRPRDWYFTLGFDVASLVSAALIALPETQATDKDEVRARHQLARAALSGARAQLVTTEARGFNADGAIERTIASRVWSRP